MKFAIFQSFRIVFLYSFYNWTFLVNIDRIRADSARDLDSISFVNSHEPNLPDFARSFRVLRHFGSHRINSGEFGARGLERRVTIVSRSNLTRVEASSKITNYSKILGHLSKKIRLFKVTKYPIKNIRLPSIITVRGIEFEPVIVVFLTDISGLMFSFHQKMKL